MFDPKLADLISTKEQRKLRARKTQMRSIWFGLGVMGIVGWSIALPMVIGTAVGLWVDRRWPSSYSFTLMGMAAGLLVGCSLAWYWIKREAFEKDDNHQQPASEEKRNAT
jgi:ATP synthase protein I